MNFSAISWPVDVMFFNIDTGVLTIYTYNEDIEKYCCEIYNVLRINLYLEIHISVRVYIIYLVMTLYDDIIFIKDTSLKVS